MTNDTNVRTGGCLCGAIHFKTTGAPVVVAHCHCRDCQRTTGAGHSTGAMFAFRNVEISGALAEYSLTSNAGNTVIKAFCQNCGSNISGRNSGTPDHVTLSLGTFGDPANFEPEVIVFAENRCGWDLMDETLPSFTGQPEWKPA